MMNEERLTSSTHFAASNGSVMSLKVLKDLSDALSGALEVMDSFKPPDVSHGISFYDEVKRFEIDLIRKALKLSAGSQKRAAQLLRIKPTTLNTKIKGYQIDWRNGYDARAETKER